MDFAQLLGLANQSPQPSAQPPGSFSGIAEPSPMSSVAVPATDPAQLEQRKSGWAALYEKFQTDPMLQQAMGLVGAQLAQPLQPGQTSAGNLANAVVTGQTAYKAGEAANYERKREAAKDTREATESAARVKQSGAQTANLEAQNPRLRAEADVARASVEAEIAKNRADANLAITKANAAKSEEEIAALEREQRARVAKLKKGVSDKTLMSVIDAENETVIQKLAVEKQRIKTMQAQEAQARAGAAENSADASVKQMTADALKGMPAEERKQFLTKTGKYSSHVSALSSQAELWGQLYDKLPAEDPVRKGTTKEQFQMKRLTESKQKDAVELLIKAKQAGMSDEEIADLGLFDLAKASATTKRSPATGTTPAGAATGNVIKMTRDANGNIVRAQ